MHTLTDPSHQVLFKQHGQPALPTYSCYWLQVFLQEPQDSFLFSHRPLGSLPLVSTFLFGTETFMEAQGCFNGISPAGPEGEREANSAGPVHRKPGEQL